MKRFLPLILILAVLAGVIIWRYQQKTTQTAQQKQQGAQRKNAPATVSLGIAGPRVIAQSVGAVGTLESPFQVKLSPNVSGRIDYLEVREGDSVKAGQTLVKIDPAEVEGQVLQAESQLAEAQQKLAQAKITQNSTAVGIYATINQGKAGVASSMADYNETAVTYDAAVGAAHEAVVDAQAKEAAANSAIQTAEANMHLAEANLEDAQAKYTRTYTLYQQGFVAPQDVDDARTQVKVQQQTVAADEKNVEAAKSAYRSNQALVRAAMNQESIARKKGQSDIADAKAKLTQSSATLDAAAANRAQIPAYVENLRALASEVTTAKAALTQAQARRTYLNVKSSIDGTVTQRLFDPGAEASPGSPILVVQFLKWLYFTSAMPVEYSDQVRVGAPMTITLDGLPGKALHAKVDEVNKSADPTSRQFMVRTRLDNSSKLFHPGMFGKVQMVTNYVDAPVVVPREAVTTDATGNSTVMLVDSKMVAHLTPVTIGAQDATGMQILSGVKAGDKVITLTYRPVKDGGKVVEGSWKSKGSRRKGAAGAGAAKAGAGAPGG